MINLIPNEEKKKMTRGFYYRLTVVFLVMLGFSLFLATFAIVPSYLLLAQKESLVKIDLEKQKKEPMPEVDEDTIAAAENLNAKFRLIEDIPDDKFIVSQKIINEIILEKMPDIKITQISYEKTATERKISIRGAAPSRDRLLVFRRALEDNVAFKKVDLPISNFVKGSNIQFYISLIAS